MKRYNINELSVVRVEDTFKDRYFICEYNKIEDIYVEIFTSEKIKVTNKNDVEALSERYSLLEVCNYSKNEPLMLDKKALLLKYIDINQKRIIPDRDKYLDYLIEHQKKTLEQLKKLSKENPELAKEISLKSLQRSGILDANGELAYPYNQGVEEEKDLIKKPIN